MAVPTSSPTFSARVLCGLVGVFAFSVGQIPLLLAQPRAAGGINAPGWFLNSGTNVLIVAIVLAAVAAVLSLATAASIGCTVWYGLGAVVAMVSVLVTIGGGTIFPIVIAFGTGVVGLAVAVGAGCGAGVRALQGHAG